MQTAIQVPILLETSEVLIVDKPVGISVHNNEDPQNLLKTLAKTHPALFPVHRLDKETSGIQVFAKSPLAAKSWAQEFQERTVRKIYAGVIKGHLKPETGVFDQPLTDKSEGRKNPQGNSRDRVLCETRYRLLNLNKYFSLIEFELVTGRQHQIRKHMALHNHPLIGDPRYGDPKYNQKMAAMYKTDRLFLHCQELEIKKHRILSPVPLIFFELTST